MRERDIDFIRGLAIIAIVFCHASQPIIGLSSVLRRSLSFGQLGCQLFFFFSGYLMYKKYLEKPYIFNKSYFWNKVKSVITPWYFAIVVYITLGILGSLGVKLYYQNNIAPLDVVINFLFLNGVVPSANNSVVPGGWYIGTLFLMWTVFPLICKWIGNSNKLMRRLLVLIIVCWHVMATFGIVFGPESVARNSFLYFSLINQLPCFLIGMIVASNRIMVRISFLRFFVSLVLAVFLFIKSVPFGAIVYPSLFSVVFAIVWKKSRGGGTNRFRKMCFQNQ